LKTDQEFGAYDYDEETTGQASNFYSLPNIENRTVASYVAKNRHTITVRDIRRPDSRFPDGSICLNVRNFVNYLHLPSDIYYLYYML
jgi:hypothetical protein